MERKNNKVCVFFIKILLSPITRFRKLKRKCKKQIEIIVVSVILTTAVITLVAYLCPLFVFEHGKVEPTASTNQLGTPMRHIPLDELYQDLKALEDDEYLEYMEGENQNKEADLLHTPGCKIPLATIDYRQYLGNGTRNINRMCGNRLVFLRKHNEDKVIARIKSQKLRLFANKNNTRIQCCYKFLITSLHNPPESDTLLFTNCTDFQDVSIITLQSDFINVICSEFNEDNTSQIIYDDLYAFAKKMKMPPPKTKTTPKSCVKYNVLIVGMESMSLPRLLTALPKTVNFLREDSWLGFQGYNKIADETLPNLMAALTGRNMSSIKRECFGSMDYCNNLFIWKAFKDAGYATAYGEDHKRNTFTHDYAFRKPPTDHYMQPFFLQENHKSKPSLCAGKLSSGQQLLDYAIDFANTYKKDSFFGIFWINSFSRDQKSRPENADKIIENFLNQLVYTGIMTNTFVLFLSAHGLRFGSHRLQMESYYDDRVPMKFVWVPLLFKGKRSHEYRALAVNQHRLTTPYDVYSTLLDIKEISQCNRSSNPVPHGCPNCQSMLKIIHRTRTCKDAAIHEKWCSCHKMYPLTVQDPIGLKSVNAAVKYIQNTTMAIKTQRCWSCAMPSLKNVTRIHFYYDEDKTKIYYVVAITLAPSNGTYEALVLRKDGYHVIGPISSISYYQGLGKCALNRRDRLLCACQINLKC